MDLTNSWITQSRRESYKGWDVIVIPKGVKIYKGQSVDKGRWEGKDFFQFYGTFQVGAWYAFNPDKDAATQKIECSITTKNIYLLNMESIYNYDKIFDFIDKTKSNSDDGDRIKDNIEFAFGYTPRKKQLERYSNTDSDRSLSLWLCNFFKNNLKKSSIIGYAYTNLKGMHGEIMLCDGHNSFKKNTNLSYRWIPYFEKNYLHEIKNGNRTGVTIPVKDIYHANAHIDPYTKEKIPYVFLIMIGMYKRLPEDKFLFIDKPILKGLESYIHNLREKNITEMNIDINEITDTDETVYSLLAKILNPIIKNIKTKTVKSKPKMMECAINSKTNRCTQSLKGDDNCFLNANNRCAKTKKNRKK